MDFYYSKSVYIIITIHGYIPVDPFSRVPELRTFEVPDSITGLNVMVSPINNVFIPKYIIILLFLHRVKDFIIRIHR